MTHRQTETYRREMTVGRVSSPYDFSNRHRARTPSWQRRLPSSRQRAAGDRARHDEVRRVIPGHVLDIQREDTFRIQIATPSRKAAVAEKTFVAFDLQTALFERTRNAPVPASRAPLRSVMFLT